MENLKKIKQELESQEEEKYLTHVYDWGFSVGQGRGKTKNPYKENTPEYYRWEKGFNDGKSGLKNKKFNCEMTFTPNCNEIMKEVLDFFEVEILQGEKNILPDGRIQYLFDASEEKMAIIRRAHWKSDMRDNIQS